RHTRCLSDWSSDVCSSDLPDGLVEHADLGGIATFHANDMVVDAAGRAWVGNFGLDFEAYVAQHGYAALRDPAHATTVLARVDPRSEERRVGKECDNRLLTI